MAHFSRSSSPHKRSSLAGHFEGLTVTKSAYKTINLPKLLRNTVRSKFTSPKAKFTLKPDLLYDYFRFTPDPDEVFAESVSYFGDVWKLLQDLKEKDDSYEQYLVESMVMMIFQSNDLEKAGSSHEVTMKLCKKIFAGEELAVEIPVEDEDYEVTQKYLKQKKRAADPDAVQRSRRQVIQHAFALKYITHRMVVHGEELSEDILLSTHKILTEGIDAENEEKDCSEVYGGVYRNDNVGWTFTSFASPKDIPKLMANTIAEFNAAVKVAEAEETIDPYQLAAKYSHKILNIHPFLDGNSRLTRLLINTILLKYTGSIITIAEDDEQAMKWKETVTRAAETESMKDEDEGSHKPPWAELATLIVIQGRTALRTLKETLVARKRGENYSRRKSIIGYHWETEESPSAREEVDATEPFHQ
ncbi:hypothetical protein ONS95_009995 [Cadophora gregata]|uniref:uncharacterized protein n=1 Tax=Cadophora gregata TaxID=51156 RepID=UPI0026DD759C|nr:uncharacterized protein ONS95_009995 [Cadophora gregata]KAK0121710.1 hypothetical protein ONS95_009995 [Cadophora gregata]KAK0127186.1 hypothetical protein ONS96_006738 [Cadophora gregata f. sp. sojae]